MTYNNLSSSSHEGTASNLTSNEFFVTFFDVDNNQYVNDIGNYTEESEFIALPLWRQVLWSVLFAIIVVVATVGNFVVIWIVFVNKRMRSVTNYLLVNLSLADAMISTLNVTINFTYMLLKNWPFGYFYCKFNQFIAVVSICASVFTLMVISIDRYMAIVNPLRPRLGKSTTLFITTAIWISSAVIGSPNLMFFTTGSIIMADGSVRYICYSEWPDGLTTRSTMEYTYNVVFMMVTYFIPIASMTYSYARIGIELWRSRFIGESSQRQMDNLAGKRRVVKMMIVIVLIFAVCWLPSHIYFIIISNYPDVTYYPPIQEIYLAIYWLAMSNSMLNPIILYWMNFKFRRGFKQFMKCCCAFGDRDTRRQGMYELQHLDRALHSHSPNQNNGTSLFKLSSKTTKFNKNPAGLKNSK